MEGRNSICSPSADSHSKKSGFFGKSTQSLCLLLYKNFAPLTLDNTLTGTRRQMPAGEISSQICRKIDRCESSQGLDAKITIISTRNSVEMIDVSPMVMPFLHAVKFTSEALVLRRTSFIETFKATIDIIC